MKEKARTYDDEESSMKQISPEEEPQRITKIVRSKDHQKKNRLKQRPLEEGPTEAKSASRKTASRKEEEEEEEA